MTEYKAKKKNCIQHKYTIQTMFPVTEGYMSFGWSSSLQRRVVQDFFFLPKVTMANRLGHIKF